MEDVKNDNQTVPSDEVKVEDNTGKTVPESADTSEAVKQPKDTTDKTVEAVNEFNAQKSYEALQAELMQQTKAYKEIRKEFTRRTQHESELQKKLNQVYETLAKATETPIDPEQFIRDLQAHGPKALEPHFEKWVSPIKAQYDKTIEERDSKILSLETSLEIQRRRLDSTNYPDFNKLESIMNEIANDDNCPVNWDLSIGESLDILYKLAKDRSSEQAVKIAEQKGYEKATKELVKESQTTVTGGGKTAGTTMPDLNKVDNIDKLREIVAQMHGIADRD